VGIESKGMRVRMKGAGGNRGDRREDTRGRTRGGERVGRSDGEGSDVEGQFVLLRLVVVSICVLCGWRREWWWLNPVLLLLLALSEIGESVHI